MRIRRGFWPTLCAILAVVAAYGFLRSSREDRLGPIPSGLRRSNEVVVVLDHEVPGTKVYLRGVCLGEVPVKLTRARLAMLGLPEPTEHGPVGVDSDGWCEGIVIGDLDESESKLQYAVPDAEAGKYLSMETPWGRRTKDGGWESSFERPFVWTAKPHPEAGDGLRLRISVPERASRNTQQTTVTVSCESVTETEVTGFRPELTIYWGTYDTPWRRRTSKTVTLPETWSRIQPGDKLEITTEIETPTVAEDYSFFAVFDLFEGQEGSRLKISAVYSDSRLLRVR